MAKSGMKLNQAALRRIRTSPPVMRELEARAKRIAGAAGSMGKGAKGYKVTPLVLEDPRGAVSVMATGHAAQHNRKHNALLKAVDSGR